MSFFRPPTEMNAIDQWTIVMIGDAKVGKTALANRYVLNCFYDRLDHSLARTVYRDLVR
ncbi:hypothetical protein CPC08DRAFT_769281 [Agrocybe pediades]|nr:hypothetical protein CPC08DRAFT_769281 [Agrocybe pediades]